MKNKTDIQKQKYMDAVAEYIISLGYEVETADPEHDLLDVWGKYKGKRCYIEIYLHAFQVMDNGLYGIWGQGDNEDEELFLSSYPTCGLDTRFFPLSILDGLKPIKKQKRGA